MNVKSIVQEYRDGVLVQMEPLDVAILAAELRGNDKIPPGIKKTIEWLIEEWKK